MRARESGHYCFLCGNCFEMSALPDLLYAIVDKVDGKEVMVALSLTEKDAKETVESRRRSDALTALGVTNEKFQAELAKVADKYSIVPKALCEPPSSKKKSKKAIKSGKDSADDDEVD